NTVKPTAALTGAPTARDEATQIHLAPTRPAPDSADTLTYAWTVTKNGTAYASGTSDSFSFTPDDNGTYIVKLKVTDDDGGVGCDTKTIIVNNVNPTASITGAPTVSDEGTQINLAS